MQALSSNVGASEQSKFYDDILDTKDGANF